MTFASPSPRRLLAGFLVAILVLASTLAWLTLRLLQQDRALERQRIEQRLAGAADLVGAALARRLGELEERLADLARTPEPTLAAAATSYADRLEADALVVLVTPDGVSAYPRTRLLYYPEVRPAGDETDDSTFDAVDALEFRRKDHLRAIGLLRELARSSVPDIKAGALVRLARNHRKANQPQAALSVYAELAGLGSISVAGAPADLLARYARCDLLRRSGPAAEFEREARALDEDLHDGRWQIHRASYLFYVQSLEGWADGTPAAATAEALSARQRLFGVAAAVETVWANWQRSPHTDSESTGHLVFRPNGEPVLALWHSASDRLVALVGGPDFISAQARSLDHLLEQLGVRMELTDVDDKPTLSSAGLDPNWLTVRSSADTRLPWTLRIASANLSADLAALQTRRWLIITAVALIGLALAGSGYFGVRALGRELRAAQLQSDFVAAVSHEFRSPLTTVRQLSELLVGGRVADESARGQYYETLLRESERLHRLVEGLLDFGRMEAGARVYRLHSIDAATFVTQVVEEFQSEVHDQSHRVELCVGCDCTVEADPEALGRAIRNLLDNAVKYSPGCQTVWIEMTREPAALVIAVRDEGLGIPVVEQAEIFKKFVRGTTGTGTAKGTGIGLAMVRHIVEGHGGRISVASKPGEGSTFTVRLPVATRG